LYRDELEGMVQTYYACLLVFRGVLPYAHGIVTEARVPGPRGQTEPPETPVKWENHRLRA